MGLFMTQMTTHGCVKCPIENNVYEIIVMWKHNARWNRDMRNIVRCPCLMKYLWRFSRSRSDNYTPEHRKTSLRGPVAKLQEFITYAISTKDSWSKKPMSWHEKAYNYICLTTHLPKRSDHLIHTSPRRYIQQRKKVIRSFATEFEATWVAVRNNAWSLYTTKGFKSSRWNLIWLKDTLL